MDSTAQNISFAVKYWNLKYREVSKGSYKSSVDSMDTQLKPILSLKDCQHKILQNNMDIILMGMI